jgi:hypothetical protein
MSRRIWLIAAVAIFPFLPKAAEADPWTITVVGTIFAETVPDQNGLFGPVGASLVGYGYSETITTNPLLNTGVVDSTPTLLERDGGVVIGCCGAPYTVTMTVNGVSYTQTESKSIPESILFDLRPGYGPYFSGPSLSGGGFSGMRGRVWTMHRHLSPCLQYSNPIGAAARF